MTQWAVSLWVRIFSDQSRQVAGRIGEDSFDLPEVGDAFRKDMTIFIEHRMQSIHEFGALMEKPLTSPEKHRAGLLIFRLRLDKRISGRCAATTIASASSVATLGRRCQDRGHQAWCRLSRSRPSSCQTAWNLAAASSAASCLPCASRLAFSP